MIANLRGRQIVHFIEVSLRRTVSAVWAASLFLLVSPAIARAQSTGPLFEIFLDDPVLQANYKIWDFGDHEELAFTSNLFLPERQEFGTYTRKSTDLPSQIEKLANSIVGTGFKPPTSRTIVWPNSHWHVFIKGEEIDPIDPRFKPAFKLLREQVKQVQSGGWLRRQVTVVKLKWRPFQVSAVQLLYSGNQSPPLRPHITRQTFHPFDACKDVFDKHLVCHIAHGFVLLNEPASQGGKDKN